MFDFLAVPMNYLVTHLAVLAGVPLAIVLATVLVRLSLVPLGYAQHRADQRRTSLLSRAAALSSEEERADLLRAEGGSLARGCLPLLLQMPVFAAMYQLFVSPTVGGHANTLLTQTLFGVPLGSHLALASGSQLAVFGTLLGLMALIGYLSARLLRPAGSPPPSGVFKVLPYLSTVFALFMPLAAMLYLVTTTTWTVVQTLVLRQVGP